MSNKTNLSKETAKNSIYNLTGTLIMRISGLFITIILARFLLPEFFGIYSLVFSIVTVALVFTDLGINNTTTRYVSYFIGKKQVKKARSYLKNFIYAKLFLSFFVVFVIILLSRFFSETVFQKPIIFFPLLFSCFYILAISFLDFSKSILISFKDFKKITSIHLIHHSLRFLFALIAVLLLKELSAVSGVFLGFSFAILIAFFYSLFCFNKNKEFFIGRTQKIENSKVTRYLFYMALVGVSLKFFGAIDTLMLGRFVQPEFIGYYRAGLNLVLTISSLLGFGAVLLPTFTQISGERLKRGFEKTSRYILMLSIPATAGLFILAKYFMIVIYGKEYLPGTLPLYVLILMVLIQPLVAFYSSVFQAKEKAKTLAKAIVFSLILNIILNYILIKSLLVHGSQYAILGAGIATVFSRFVYLVQLSFKTKKQFKLTIHLKSLCKFVFSSLIMSLFLIIFNMFIDINIFYGIIEVIVGILIYFGILYLIKGLEKQDIELLNSIFRKIKTKF